MKPFSKGCKAYVKRTDHCPWRLEARQTVTQEDYEMATQSKNFSPADEYPLRRPSLGKRLTSWSKKGAKGHPVNSDGRSAELEIVEIPGTQEFFVGDRMLELGTVNDEKWAVIWLGKLLHRRKLHKKSDGGKRDPVVGNHVRVVTLAEQLAEAQAADLDTLAAQTMTEVLQNPSRAKKFFQRLSRTPPPAEYQTQDTSFGFKNGPEGPQPLTYLRQPDRDLSDLSKEKEQVMAELASLERQIEELGQTINKDSQDSFVKFGNEMEDVPKSQLPLPSSRPQPSLERISFFSYWWGYEIAIPKSKMQSLQGAKQAMEVFIEFVTLLAPSQIKVIKPLVTIITEYLRTNYQIALMQDNGKGVILAATWLLPVLIIPRAWDYPNPESSSPTVSHKSKIIL